MGAAPRRRLACQGVLAVMLGAGFKRTAMAQEGAPRAALLVATQHLKGSMFERSVVVVAQAPDGNTIGLILNRPGAAAPPPDLAGPDAGAQGARVFLGGPLAPQSFFALAEGSGAVDGAFALADGIQLAAGSAAVRRLFSAAGVGRRKLFRGYSGWGDGQLAREIKGGFWIPRPIVGELLFDPAPDAMWERLNEAGRAVRMPPASPPAAGPKDWGARACTAGDQSI